MRVAEIEGMPGGFVRAYLTRLMRKLDDLDGEDYFGTEGWRYTLMEEDD